MKIRKSLAVLGASASLALGFGGVMAPSAQAHAPVWGEATYTQANVRGGVTHTGFAVERPNRALTSTPASARTLRCSNSRVSYRTVSTTCSGYRWRAYADCSDGNRYLTPVLRGAKRVSIVCPAGSRAVEGGAFGR